MKYFWIISRRKSRGIWLRLLNVVGVRVEIVKGLSMLRVEGCGLWRFLFFWLKILCLTITLANFFGCPALHPSTFSTPQQYQPSTPQHPQPSPLNNLHKNAHHPILSRPPARSFSPAGDGHIEHDDRFLLQRQPLHGNGCVAAAG